MFRQFVVIWGHLSLVYLLYLPTLIARFLPEGSEDELDVSAQLDEDSMDKSMVALDSSIDILKEYGNNNLHNDENTNKFGLKPVEQLYEKLKSDCDENLKYVSQHVNGWKLDLGYNKCRELAQAGVVPNEIELRDGGVFAAFNLAKATRYGPFQGKWAGIPQDPRFAWEVSELKQFSVSAMFQ